jgi:hypothetical protein
MTNEDGAGNGSFRNGLRDKKYMATKKFHRAFAALQHGTAEPFSGSHSEPRQMNGEARTK